jgi:TolB-like protein/phosphoglycolate phosphatase-like HAD superfamily hydrolase
VTDATQGEGAWAKLRRRKVVQWGIAYAAGAWGFLQGLEYVSEAFGWPGHIRQVALLALLIGLPIVLVVAWYHGDRGQQRVTATELAILTLLFLLGGGIFWRYDIAADAPRAAAPAASSAPAGPAVADARPSIAVLPFVNMSEDKSNEYFSDGISEELLNVLVRVDGLGVASRTSSFGYKGSPLGTAAIAQALKVNHILEGSVRKSGNRVRITAQLIDAVNDRHLWSETYDRELHDIFAIQDEIANAIVAALRGTLGAAQAGRVVTVRADTENLEAYDLYLKARELFIARRDLEESVRLFEGVVEMDPDFARGWEGLAAVTSVVESWGIRDRDYTALARQAAKRALDLDPSLSMPWAALAMAEQQGAPVDWARSLEMSDRAIAADPKNATAYLWRSISFVNLGFFAKAIADQDRCLALDPAYQNCLRWKSVAVLFKGDAEAALRMFQQGVAAGFVTNRAESFIEPLVRRGDELGAILLLQALGARPELARIVIDALARPDAPHPEAGDVVARFMSDQSDRFVLLVGQSRVHLWLGDYDGVATAPDIDNDVIVAWERFPPAFRNSKGFKHTLERLGVTSYWREHGYPPQCRAVGQDDFTCD